MGKYIGNSAPYGIYEKQALDITAGVTKYSLSYRVGYSTSILVIWDFAGASRVLLADVDYFLVDGGTAIQLTFDPVVADTYVEKLHVIYLGKELAVPVPAEKSPILVQTSNQTSDAIFVTNQVVLDSNGLLVIKNGTQLRFGTDFELQGDHSIKLLAGNASTSDVFDFYVFSGLARLQTTSIVDHSVTSEKISDKAVTPEKLNLKYDSYENEFLVNYTELGIGQLGSLIASNVTVEEALYMEQGDTSNVDGAPVRVRVKFQATLSGAPDNKIRFILPTGLINISTVIGGTVVISNDKTVETGILRWASSNSIDIYRPSGTNFELSSTAGSYVFEAAFEYLAKVSS